MNNRDRGGEADPFLNTILQPAPSTLTGIAPSGENQEAAGELTAGIPM